MPRTKNEDYRQREYLTPEEIKLLLKAAKEGKHGHRNYTMILLSFHHGLRVSELVSLLWSSINLDNRTIFCLRCKGSKSGEHNLEGVELRALRQLQREYPGTPYLFPSRGSHLTAFSFWEIIRAAGQRAGLGPNIHPHQLRHSTGYFLAQSHDLLTVMAVLGHKNVSNTTRYTAIDPSRLKNLFKDY